ncbi:lanthionine synthetase C family protein [Nonomuraea sp. SYSU D8015]|uniref:lanthionine synthetase C family protein n=1 Tax=Nonomuraea sp. SYSU D8015 TaxID=2593644 RepID=UPI001CB6CF5B|nr:lanthionine synthetase C family protein [Nonomuraea sp. SYSU D8015]
MTTTAHVAMRLAGARVAADQLAAALAVPPPPDPAAGYDPDSPRWHGQSLSVGAPGIAILHGIRALDGAADWAPARAWLACALREYLAAGGGAGLWHGAPAVAFALHTATPPDQNRHLLQRLDAAIVPMVHRRLEEAGRRLDARLRPLPGEFDLVNGLTGLGAYLLHRAPRHVEALREVLAYLVWLTQPVPADDAAGADAPGWWTPHLPAGHPGRPFADGHSDQGIAHGICGPLALLALAARAGITVHAHHEAMATICAWLQQWRYDGPAGPWWPERITLAELRQSRSRHHGPARPSWCYGTPGIARALQLAALALDHPGQARAAEDALLACITDTAQLDRLDTLGLCHGWAGMVASTWTAAAEATTPGLAQSLPPLVDAFLHRAATIVPGQPPGLIDGAAGVALVLHSITTPGPWRGWETCLLLA